MERVGSNLFKRKVQIPDGGHFSRWPPNEPPKMLFLLVLDYLSSGIFAIESHSAILNTDHNSSFYE